MPVSEKEIRELIVFFIREEKSGVEILQLLRRKTGASDHLILRIIREHYPKLLPSLVLAKVLPEYVLSKKGLNKRKTRRSKSPPRRDVYDLPRWKRRQGYTF